MIKNVIKHNDKIYIVDRQLPSSTTEESANRIHNALGTNALLRNQQGEWFCCKVAKEVQFRDINNSDDGIKQIIPPKSTNEDFAHTQFELNDFGGLG